MTFDDFWQAYPRKVGKAMARAKFLAVTSQGLSVVARDRDGNRIDLTHQEAAEALVEAAKAYRLDCLDTEERYIAHPTTWLNQGRWEDYDETERRQKAAEMDRLTEKVIQLRVVG